MKNLLERLKPYIRENLESTKDIYPHSYKSFIEELSNSYAVTEVKFGTLTSLTSYTDGKYGYTILDLYEMFNN
tara:strand:- start:634 stop:852 length:219 start_codon:yes stop_codon:yes gene_type:complete